MYQYHIIIHTHTHTIIIIIIITHIIIITQQHLHLNNQYIPTQSTPNSWKNVGITVWHWSINKITMELSIPKPVDHPRAAPCVCKCGAVLLRKVYVLKLC